MGVWGGEDWEFKSRVFCSFICSAAPPEEQWGPFWLISYWNRRICDNIKEANSFLKRLNYLVMILCLLPWTFYDKNLLWSDWIALRRLGTLKTHLIGDWVISWKSKIKEQLCTVHLAGPHNSRHRVMQVRWALATGARYGSPIRTHKVPARPPYLYSTTTTIRSISNT